MTPIWRCHYCGERTAFYARTCAAHRDLLHLDPLAPVRGTATIQAIDTDDDTFYVLYEDGVAVQTAPWPQMLEELRPDATRIPSYPGPRHGLA